MKNSGETKKKKFKLFDMNRDGKGVYEEENRKPTIPFFFKLFFRKFSQLLQLNLLLLLMIIPFLVWLFTFLVGLKTPTATDVMFAPLYGINAIVESPALSNILDLSSVQMMIPISSPVMNVIIITLFVILAITWGWQNAGAAYVLRGLFRGDPVFVFSDYFYGIKRNLKQAFFLGLIDFACTGILIFDLISMNSLTGQSFGVDFMYFAVFALLIIWVIMRFYIYTMLVTFNISNFKILKNAIIFAVLGILRNAVALVGMALLIGIHVFLFIYTSITFPAISAVTIVIPFVYVLSAVGFMGMFAAYPVVHKYMVAPVESTEPADSSDIDAE